MFFSLLCISHTGQATASDSILSFLETLGRNSGAPVVGGLPGVMNPPGQAPGFAPGFAPGLAGPPSISSFPHTPMHSGSLSSFGGGNTGEVKVVYRTQLAITAIEPTRQVSFFALSLRLDCSSVIPVQV